MLKAIKTIYRFDSFVALLDHMMWLEKYAELGNFNLPSKDYEAFYMPYSEKVLEQLLSSQDKEYALIKDKLVDISGQLIGFQLIEFKQEENAGITVSLDLMQVLDIVYEKVKDEVFPTTAEAKAEIEKKVATEITFVLVQKVLDQVKEQMPKITNSYAHAEVTKGCSDMSVETEQQIINLTSQQHNL